jgi:class 3 adenylate cyclase
MKGIVESHGGSVEKFIGDAVMAVFGVPVAHVEDNPGQDLEDERKMPPARIELAHAV